MGTAVQFSRIRTIEDQISGLPKGLSIFDPIIPHETKEAIEAGGEAYVSQNPRGEANGLFIYDNWEATGTIFTKSREVFDIFFGMKPSSYIFSELDVPDHTKETWNIWQLDVEKAPVEHKFRHHVSMTNNVREIERFMAATQPETNMRWITVALRSGDKCFVTKIADRIVGMAWMTMANGIARSHGLYVEPQFRRMGIMRDNLQARLIYLKSRGIHALINEIAEPNIPSSKHAEKAGEKIVGKIFLYTTPD